VLFSNITGGGNIPLGFNAVIRTGITHTDAVLIRVYDEAGTVIETHEHKGEFKGSAARLAQVCSET
jgi:hypothetical protein